MKNLEKEVRQLRKDVDAIIERNKKVEKDKAWETSRVRTGFIAVVTFLFVIGFVMFINDEKPLQKGLIASIGYFLSTETYGILKKWWIAKKPS